MGLEHTAEENLKVIRTLMERATVYRTVSVPAAAWGGFLSVAAFGVQLFLEKRKLAFLHPDALLNADPDFLFLWLTVLVLAVAGNLFFLHREARRNGGPFFSPACRAAAWKLLPTFLIAAVLTAMGIWKLASSVQAFVWILFYGLGLLSAHNCAPRSLIVLGWLFTATAPIIIVLNGLDIWTWIGSVDSFASAMMALTFGGYHLGYAAIVYCLELRRKKREAAALA